MPDYIQLTISVDSQAKKDWAIAELSNGGFEGFEETENDLKAFIPNDEYNEIVVNEISERIGFTYVAEKIEETNWNQVWESGFEPVIIPGFVAIRADFHEAIDSVPHEIIITPKMSFGTGHHATTYLMMNEMKKITFADQSVFDFGTGTAVLAILAEKLGAKLVDAIDIDEWSINNANENIERNGCKKIVVRKADAPPVTGNFDVILANINKHILMESIPNLALLLQSGGHLLLSGLLLADEEDIMQKAHGSNLFLVHRGEKDNWLCLRLSIRDKQ